MARNVSWNICEIPVPLHRQLTSFYFNSKLFMVPFIHETPTLLWYTFFAGIRDKSYHNQIKKSQKIQAMANFGFAVASCKEIGGTDLSKEGSRSETIRQNDPWLWII